jgi:cell division protein FtsQ
VSTALFAARADRRRRLMLRGVLAMLVVLTLLGGAAWVLLDSGQLATARVEVTGLDRLDRAEVLRGAGVRLGEPLVLLDTDEVSRRITASLPAAGTARVSRGWPRTVRIDVGERVAVAGVRTDAGVRLLDREGVVFALDPKLPAGLVPIVVDGAQGVAAPGAVAPGAVAPGAGASAAEVEAASARAVSNAAVVVAALPPQVREQVEQVTARSQDAIDLELRDGRTVHWGGPDRSARKVLVLQALLGHAAEVYDVSAPDVPTTRG